jgi:uroporphyrinogen decarboxylase
VFNDAGGVDTKELLVHGTPEEISREIRRLKGVFGPRWIVRPSHEALLPDVPLENVRAMAEAARNA